MELAAAMMQFMSPEQKKYEVAETLFDADQNWAWTTILGDTDNMWGGYQALTPRDQLEILSIDSIGDMREFVVGFFERSMLDKGQLVRN